MKSLLFKIFLFIIFLTINSFISNASENKFAIEANDTLAKPNIIGRRIVCENEILNYGTLLNNKNTYKWRILGGIILTDSTSNVISVLWGKRNPAQLIVEEKNPDGDSKSDTMIINLEYFYAEILGEHKICPEQNYLYIVPAFPNVLSTIKVNNGTIVYSNNVDSLIIKWHKTNIKDTIWLEQSSANAPCNRTIIKELEKVRNSCFVSIDDFYFDPKNDANKLISIPIKIDSTITCNDQSIQFDSIQINLKIRNTIFLPIKNNEQTYIDDKDWKLITIKNKNIDVKGNLIAELKGYILLADTISSKIEIENIIDYDNFSNFIYKNGSINLIGISNAGGPRLLKESNELTSFEISPNPAKENINLIINSPENQISIFEIFDILGNKIFSKEIELSIGECSFEIQNFNENINFNNETLLMAMLKSNSNICNKVFIFSK